MFSIFEAMSFKFTIAYFKHQLTANNRHGTHSPFVYKLADEVIYDFSLKKAYETVEAQRKKLLNDDSIIEYRELAKYLTKPLIAQLIFRLAANHAPKNVIVLGTDLGITTAYLAKACPQAKLIAIEEASPKAAIAKKVFEELNLNNVELLVGNYNALLPKLINQTTGLEVAYINGDHTKTAILNYFNLCLPHLHEHSLLIIADINRSEEMKAAWTAIKNHPKVTVTINLFWLGLVYFKKGQAKEHFKLKF